MISDIYRTQIPNQPIRSRAYCADILRYQVTDLIWVRYHAHLAKFGYRGKYQARLVIAMGILAQPRIAKTRTISRPNWPGKRCNLRQKIV